LSKFLFYICLSLLCCLTVISYEAKSNVIVNEKSHNFAVLSVNTDTKFSKDILVILREKKSPPSKIKTDYKYNFIHNLNNLDSSAMAGDGNYVIFNKDSETNIRIESLKPDTYYILDTYKASGNSKNAEKIASLEFTTLAEQPLRQVQMILWADVTKNSFKLLSEGAQSQNVMYVVSKGENDFVPVDATSYKANATFGKGFEAANGVYVVKSDADTSKIFSVNGLEPGTAYYVRAYALNGKGQSVNYHEEVVKKRNSVKIITKLETPVIKSFNCPQTGACRVEWAKVKGADTYILELSNDDKFETLHEIYNALDVGDVDSYVFDELESNRTYFIRIKALGKVAESDYSNHLSKKL